MKRWLAPYAALALISGSAVLALQRPTPAQGLAGISKIAFTSERDRNREIYVMNADGSNPVNLTKNPADDFQPTWSPNADKIAFASTRDGNAEICVMNADGSNQNCITSNPTTNHKPDKSLPDDQLPSWSPDGLHIVFRSTRDSNMQIYVIEAGGGAPLNLSSNSSNDDQPAWSPDLRTIAFASDRAGNPEICLMDASGFNQRCLTNNKTTSGKHDPSKPSDSFPAWSPDSQQLAYVHTQGSRSDLYIMAADGSNPHMLVKSVAPTEHPAWSPDGKSIAFVSLNRGKAEISVVGIDGKNQVGITAPSAVNFAPAWQPLPPPPGSTPTPVLTNTPSPTPQPPSPTPGGTSLIVNNQDVCALKDGITLAVPITLFGTDGMGGFTPTFSVTPGVEVVAVGTMKGYGIVGLAFIQEDVADKLATTTPDTENTLGSGLIGTIVSGEVSNDSTATDSYTFTAPARFRIYAFGGTPDGKSVSISVHVTCNLVAATPGATEAATAGAGLEIVTGTPSVTPTKIG